MNSEENNEKQIEKLARMERIYADEKKHESVMDRIKTEDDDVCAIARKFFRWALLIVWVACAVTLVTGGDFSIAAGAALIAAGVYSALCVTKFLSEGKKGDVVISVIVAVATISLGILLLVSYTGY
jgi:hypothetical protein